MLEKIDPFRITFGIASLGSTYSSIALRADNSILWQSPKWAGFQGGIGYSTAVDGAEAAGSSNNNTLITSALSYSNGPLYVLHTGSPQVAYHVNSSAGPPSAQPSKNNKARVRMSHLLPKILDLFPRKSSVFGATGRCAQR